MFWRRLNLLNSLSAKEGKIAMYIDTCSKLVYASEHSLI